jgi:hypothetical protein
MIWVEGETFENQDIKLDFTRWRKCIFKGCNILVKSGEFDLVDCSFENCKLTLLGNAIAIIKVCKIFFPEIPVIE